MANRVANKLRKPNKLSFWLHCALWDLSSLTRAGPVPSAVEVCSATLDRRGHPQTAFDLTC